MSQHEDSEAQSIEERIAAELGEFAAAEATKLGLDRDQWVEPINTTFTRSQRETTTMLVSGRTLARRNSWTADQTRVRGRRMPSSSMEWPNPGGGLLMGGGVRAGVGLLHACLSACWPTALVLPLCPLPLPCVSSGLLVLPDAVCTARSCQHRLLVKLGAERH